MDFGKSRREENQHLLPTMPLVVFLKFDGNKKSPTRKCCDVLDSPLCTFTKLGHILRIPKSMMYSELVDGTRKRGRPTLFFKDVCKHNLKILNVGTDKWEELGNDRNKWRSSVSKSL